MTPIVLLATLFSAQTAPVPSPQADELYGPIFHDIRLNILVGNGNRMVTMSWVSDHDLGIRDLSCRPRADGQRCRFTLIRKEDATVPDGPGPDRLACRADLVLRTENGRIQWQVVHRPPPPSGGHSLTSMSCRAAGRGAR